MGSTSQLKKGVLWTTVANIFNAIYGFIAVPLLINHFGKSEYGLIGLAMSINVYIQLMDMGLNSTNIRFYAKWLTLNNLEKLVPAFQTSLVFYSIVGGLNAIILLFLSSFSDNIFNVNETQDLILKNLLYILAVSAFCNWLSSCFDQLIKSTENVAWIQKRLIFTKGLMILVLILTISLNVSIELYFFLTCLSSIVMIPMSFNKIKRELPFISFLPKWNMKVFTEMFPYMMNIFSFGLFQFSFYNLRPVFLGMQGSIESVADYRILNGIVGVVTMVGGAFTGTLLPAVSKVKAKNNQKAFYTIAYDGTKYISILLCLCCFGMMTIGKEIICLYVGKDYLYLLQWLYIWLLCTLGNHNQAISSLILAGNDIRAITKNSIIASILGLVVAWILIPYFDIGGVCIAYAIYMSIQLLFYYLYYWPKILKINSFYVFYKSFCPYCLIGYVCYFFSSNIIELSNYWISALIKGALFLIMFALLSYVTLSQKDKKFIFTNK